MKLKIINIGLVLAAVALLGILALHVRLHPTANRVAVLKTAGMNCGSCAGKIEESIGSSPGIAGVEVGVDDGWVAVGYDARKAKPEAFAELISRRGFRSRLVQTMSVDEFRRATGREFGTEKIRPGCCGKPGCGR